MIRRAAKKSNANSDRSGWSSFSGRTPHPRAARCNAADNSSLRRRFEKIAKSSFRFYGTESTNAEERVRHVRTSRSWTTEAEISRRCPRPAANPTAAASSLKITARRPRSDTARQRSPVAESGKLPHPGLSERRPGELRAREKSVARGTGSATCRLRRGRGQRYDFAWSAGEDESPSHG
jgi:hypothetical protein